MEVVCCEDADTLSSGSSELQNLSSRDKILPNKGNVGSYLFVFNVPDNVFLSTILKFKTLNFEPWKQNPWISAIQGLVLIVL